MCCAWMESASRLQKSYVGTGELRGSARVTQQQNTHADAEGRLAFNDNIACDFAARAEGLLRFAVEFGLNASGVAQRQDKLVLAFISGFFSRSE